MTLNGERVLVCGGTSGIGAATARLFAGRGADAVVTGRDAGRLATKEWTLRLHLFEEGPRTAARLVLDTGDTTLEAHGEAHRDPHDALDRREPGPGQVEQPQDEQQRHTDQDPASRAAEQPAAEQQHEQHEEGQPDGEPAQPLQGGPADPLDAEAEGTGVTGRRGS